MARHAEVNEALRHLKIPSSHIDSTGVELGNMVSGLQWKVVRS